MYSAQISFTQPLRVSWVNGSQEVPLGLFNLEPLSVKKKRAYINQTTDFTIGPKRVWSVHPVFDYVEQFHLASAE